MSKTNKIFYLSVCIACLCNLHNWTRTWNQIYRLLLTSRDMHATTWKYFLGVIWVHHRVDTLKVHFMHRVQPNLFTNLTYDFPFLLLFPFFISLTISRGHSQTGCYEGPKPTLQKAFPYGLHWPCMPSQIEDNFYPNSCWNTRFTGYSVPGP